MGIIIPSFYEYSLTPEEEATSARIGYERQLPMFAQPERNRNYYEGEVWEMWQHAVCAGAELAFARMCGLDDFVPHVNKFKTVEDVSGWEVRYSFGNNVLRFSEWDNPDIPYVLLTEGLRHRVKRTKEQNWLGIPYKAVAWAYGYEIAQKGEKLGKSWRLHRSNAHKMLEIQQHFSAEFR